MDRTTLNKVLRRKGPRWRFSVDEAQRIVEATGGEVTLAACLFFWPKPDRPKSRGGKGARR